MSNYETALLVGGAYGGKQIEVDKKQDYIKIALPRNPDEETYMRVQFHYGPQLSPDAQPLTMFVPRSVHPDFAGSYAMRHLQDVYARATEKS